MPTTRVIARQPAGPMVRVVDGLPSRRPKPRIVARRPVCIEKEIAMANLVAARKQPLETDLRHPRTFGERRIIWAIWHRMKRLVGKEELRPEDMMKPEFLTARDILRKKFDSPHTRPERIVELTNQVMKWMADLDRHAGIHDGDALREIRECAQMAEKFLEYVHSEKERHRDMALFLIYHNRAPRCELADAVGIDFFVALGNTRNLALVRPHVSQPLAERVTGEMERIREARLSARENGMPAAGMRESIRLTPGNRTGDLS